MDSTRLSFSHQTTRVGAGLYNGSGAVASSLIGVSGMLLQR